MGWESLVDSSAEDNAYFPSREYEAKSGIHELIDDYDSESFWDQLIDRLTERDVAVKMGSNKQERLSDNAYDAIANPIAETYSREFAANGIERLKIGES